MVAAYILINTKPGTLKEAADAIMKVDGVRSIEAVTGPYDAVSYVEAATPDAVGQLVVSQIQKIPGIDKTLTCLIVELAAAKAA